MLNAKERFTVTSITRQDVAEALNQYLDADNDTTTTRFEKNDTRLTVELCQRYATALGQVAHLDEDASEAVEAEAEALASILASC